MNDKKNDDLKKESKRVSKKVNNSEFLDSYPKQYVSPVVTDVINSTEKVQRLFSHDNTTLNNLQSIGLPTFEIPNYSGLFDDSITNMSKGISGLYGTIEKMKSLNWYNQLTSSSIEVQDKNEMEIINLRKKLREQKEQISDLKSKGEDTSHAFAFQEKIIAELEIKNSLANILSRLNNDGSELLMTSNQFLSKFNHLSQTNAVVISIDIRRSTELMLKASSPEDFANFITGLSEQLSAIIRLNYGVFDKFTGDGILAFFPDFYSGDQAILLALRAAQECHDIFKEHYNSFEDSFDVFLEDIGLGIGIDYGLVSIVNNKAELTVVGKPVVYACRFSGAKAGETLLGQNAKKLINERFLDKVELEVSSIFIKNEGNARCFKVLKSNLIIENPDWSSFKYTINENLDDLTDDDVVAASTNIDN